MQISINFDTKQVLNIERKFADTINRHIPEAARRSLVDGRTKARTEIGRNLKPLYNRRAVKLKEIFTALDRQTTVNIKTTSINRMVIHMVMPDRSFGAIRFVKGRKKPAKQKGVKVKDRKKIKVEITPGIATELPHAFIARGRKKADGSVSKSNYHVFRKDSNKKMKRMATPSIATYAAKFLTSHVAPPVTKKMQDSFTRNLRALSKVF